MLCAGEEIAMGESNLLSWEKRKGLMNCGGASLLFSVYLYWCKRRMPGSSPSPVSLAFSCSRDDRVAGNGLRGLYGRARGGSPYSFFSFGYLNRFLCDSFCGLNGGGLMQKRRKARNRCSPLLLLQSRLGEEGRAFRFLLRS